MVVALVSTSPLTLSFNLSHLSKYMNDFGKGKLWHINSPLSPYADMSKTSRPNC